MTEVVTPIATGISPVGEAQRGACDRRAARGAEERGGNRGSTGSAPLWVGGILGAAGGVGLVSSAALAYHNTTDTTRGGGGAPLDVILPIAGAVALGMIALTIWGRRTKGTKTKAGKRKRRGKPAGRKQG